MGTTTFYSRPVIPLLLSMISGIVVGAWLPGHGTWMGVVVLVCAATLLVFIRKKRTPKLFPLVLFIALGYLSIQPWVAPTFPSNHVIHFMDTHPWKITGVVVTSDAKHLNRQKCILRAEFLESKGKPFPVKGRIRLTVSGDAPDLASGDRIVFLGRIRSIRNFGNPGGFDYQRYMAFKKVWGSAYVQAHKLTLIEKNAGKRLGAVISGARHRISKLIDQIGDKEQQGVLKALIVGDRNAISPELRTSFNRVGAGHLLAISGLHIGIIATASFLLFKWMLSHIRFFLLNAWTKKGAVVLSIVPVLVYGLLSGMSPSTQRAVIMVMVFLTAFLFEREHDLVNTLAIAAMMILIVRPPSVFSISFQFSFAAVLAIIYGFSRLPPLRPAGQNRTGKQKWSKAAIKLYYFFMTSFFAILGTLPLVMHYFNQVSLVGLPANVIFVPLIGFVVVPLGIMAVFIYPLTAAGALVCLRAGSAVLEYVIKIINLISGWTFAAVKTITPNYLEICCFYILFWVLLNLKKGQIRAPAALSKDRSRQGKTSIQKPVVIVGLLMILMLSADVGYWLYQRCWRDDLRVTMIDVGHGNASLLELPYGYNMLIDGGGFSDNRVFDVGASIVAPFLWQKKIRTIDTIVLSHPNSDHLNGLIYIAENFHVENVWTNHETAGTFGYRMFIKTIKKNNIQMPAYNEIKGVHDINGVRIDVLYPPVDFIDKKGMETWRNLDNNSLVLKASFGATSFLFPGDIKARGEYELVSTAEDKLKSTVLLAPHHGSKTSSTETFLEKVTPEVVVISSRWKSRFGFPHPLVLNRYKAKGCRVLETAHNGAVSMQTDGRQLTIMPTVTDKKTATNDIN
ncbi:MAG: DNA internalization-related competence protein ComEC/Rec2 [Deltaproteobacteria bacterium]|nr:DNA internalization-related competence protein ComEC/Rec2 [Deltaproteobacteria bacterium]